MKSNLKVKIQLDKPFEEKYIIKDNNNIIIGRFNILELNDSSKRCEIRLNFYRDDNYELLYDTLNLILKATFNNNQVYKVNIRAIENINVNAFLNSGFTLEGVLSQNEYYKGEYLDEFIFGITRMEYSKQKTYPIIELQGRNLVLRNLTPGNADQLLHYYNKNRSYLAPFEPDRNASFYTLEGQRDSLIESYKQFLNGTSIELGIFNNTNDFIGKIKLSNIVYGSLKSGVLG